MTVEEVIAARLATLAPVIALVGARVYLDRLPQAVTYPAVRVQLIDDLRGYHLRGENQPQQARVQVDAYVNEASGVDPYAQVASLADAIDGDGKGPAASGLSGWKGRVGSPPFVVLSCFRANRLRPRYDPDELNVLTMTQDFLVTYTGA